MRVVPASRFVREIEAYESTSSEDFVGLGRKLRSLERKYGTTEKYQDLQLLTGDTRSSSTSWNAADVLPPVAPQVVIPAPAGREPAQWAPREAINVRGRVDPGSNHFLAACTVNGVSTDVVVDTGGARTMMDVDTADAMGLDIDVILPGE